MLFCPWDSLGKTTGVGCWSGLLPNPGIEPASLTSSALAGGSFYHQHHLGSPHMPIGVIKKHVFLNNNNKISAERKLLTTKAPLILIYKYPLNTRSSFMQQTTHHKR